MQVNKPSKIFILAKNLHCILKTSLEHLPENKQEELRLLKKIITNDHDVHMLILFGSFATNTWVDDLYEEEGIVYSYQSDFDLLVITPREDFKIKNRIEQAIEGQYHDESFRRTPVNPIFHSIKHVNEMLEYGNYFFGDIKKEGIVLYDSRKYALSKAKELTNEEKKKRADEHFEQWLSNASNALKNYVQLLQVVLVYYLVHR